MDNNKTESVNQEMIENSKSNKRQMLLIVLCWCGYIFAYLGRYGFSANINLIMSDYGVTKSEVGLVTSFFFFAYGAGQIINGILSKKYNKRIMIPVALLVSSALNVCIFVGVSFEYIKWMWLVNGFAQSILWPTTIEILSKNLNKSKLKLAVVFMSTATPVGTFIVYGSSALLVAFNVYKYIFLIATIVMSFIGVCWFIAFNHFKAEKEYIESNSSDVTAEHQVETKKSKALIHALITFIVVMSIFAIFDNLIKDGLTTWVPTILKDLYNLPDSLSIILTITLPLLGTFGALFAIFVNKKVKNYTLLTVVFFAFSAVTLIGSLFVVDTQFSWIALIALFGITVLNMHAINNVVTSMVPLFMRDKMSSGLLSGILNGFCYLGSTISSYGLARIVDVTNSWSSVFNLLIIGTSVCVFLGVLQYVLSKKGMRK